MASAKEAEAGLTADDLQFHETLLTPESSPERDTQALGVFTNDADEADETNDEEKLLGKTNKSFWTFEYYQQFFNVESKQVMRRMVGSALPNPHMNYLQHHIRPNPDLYGPFWVCATLVFTTAITGNLANYFQQHGRNYTWEYDFHKVTLAASAIFAYWWLVPTLLWGLLWWRKSRAGFTFLEMLCIYGYSLSIYIPISILWLIPANWLQWLLVLAGMCLSGAVLVITFWPAVSDDDRRVAVAMLVLLWLFHGLLAAGFVLYFFHIPAIAHIQPVHNTTEPVTPVPHVNVTGKAG